MINLFVAFICLSVFISALTLGLRIISGEGMVLYPLRKWLFSFGKGKQKVIASAIHRKELKIKSIQHKTYTEQSAEDVNKLNDEIEELKWKSFVVDAWHKPLLTCAPCMCSIHGITSTLYFYYFVGWQILIVAPFSIFFSVLINSILWNNLKL